MSDFGEEYTHVPLQCDRTSGISVAKETVLHSKTKHIEVRYHLLRDNVEKWKISLIHVLTHDQLADIVTKPLDQATFTRLRGGSMVYV
jgi:mannitol-specific phosphotransferase system IIBC component